MFSTLQLLIMYIYWDASKVPMIPYSMGLKQELKNCTRHSEMPMFCFILKGTNWTSHTVREGDSRGHE